MWDEQSRFYYSLREHDDAKAMVREIVGFYPFAFELAPASHEDMFARLVDPAEFWTPFPPASSSLQSPATSQDGWPIGPGGSQAMWNGPTWPHAISIMADAMATVLNYCCRSMGRDWSRPSIGEFYHGETGIVKTGERDYFHSTYADILIMHLIGLVPRDDDRIQIDPLLPDGKWEHFLLGNVFYRGHDVTIAWDAPGGDDHYHDGEQGLSLWVDGALVASRPDLGPLEVDLPAARLYVTEDASGAPRLRLDGGAGPWAPFRSASPTLSGALPLAGSPAALPDIVDATAPAAGVVYYSAGACGSGR